MLHDYVLYSNYIDTLYTSYKEIWNHTPSVYHIKFICNLRKENPAMLRC